MPPDRPQKLLAYLGCITRCLALNRYDYLSAQKRNGGLTVQLAELEECLSGPDTAESRYEQGELAAEISAFLRTLGWGKRNIFIRRYWFSNSIDDDLIQEAGEARGGKARRTSFVRLIAAAACLCLAFGAVWLRLWGDVIVYNELPLPYASKVITPAGEDVTVLTLTDQELFEYYGLKPLPEALSRLRRTGQAQYFVYQAPEGIVFDTNKLYYESEDGTRSLSVSISKVGAAPAANHQEARKSRIGGVPLILAVSRNTPESSVYWAEASVRGVLLHIEASGVDEAGFTVLVREMVVQ